MRCCKIVTSILILSIVNLAFGAPATVRERLEMMFDVDVAEGASGTATSQKRHDPLDDWSTTNAADRPHSPPMLTPSELDRLWEEVAEQSINRHSPATPESPTLTESVDSNPESPTAVSHPDLTGGSPPPPLLHPDPGPSLAEDHFTSVKPNTLSSTDRPPTAPQSPTGGGSPLPPHPGPPHDHFPSPLGISASENPDTFSSMGNLPPPMPPMPPQRPAGGSPLPYTGSSEGRFPATPGASPLPYPTPSDGGFLDSPGWWESAAEISPSTGHQPTPPQIPTGGSALPPLPHPGPSEDRFLSSSGWLGDPNFLDDLLHGRIKRRVNMVQRDSSPRSTKLFF